MSDRKQPKSPRTEGGSIPEVLEAFLPPNPAPPERPTIPPPSCGTLPPKLASVGDLLGGLKRGGW